MKVLLMGYMGSGKTAVGKKLSAKINMPFIDLDQQISLEEQREIPEIFSTSGEIYFRKKETEVLEDLITSDAAMVLGLGGGTPCYGNNLQLLKNQKDVKLIYLKASLKVLTKRLFEERSGRPLIAHLQRPEDLEDFVRKHLFERTYYYNQSDIIVDTDSKNVTEVVEDILKKLA